MRVIFLDKFCLENIKVHFKSFTSLLKGHANTIKLPFFLFFSLLIFNFHGRKFPDCRFFCFVLFLKPRLYYLAWVRFWGSVSFEILPSIKRHFALWPNLLGHRLYSLSASILSFLAERGRFSPTYRVLAIFVIFK